MAHGEQLAAAPDEQPAGRVVQRDVVVVGASAGGVEALTKLVRGLPPELPAAIFVVLHVLPSGTSVLPAILGRAGPLPASAAVDGEEIERGRIYVAPPDHHMLLRDDCLRLTRGPRENGHRPAIDPLFRSAARTFGPRAIGVVLSGALDDGAAGLLAIHRNGGEAVVQDPDDALYSSMPRSALAAAGVARSAPVDAMAELLCSLIDEPLDLDVLDDPVGSDDSQRAGAERSDDAPTLGELSGLTCPECGGALWEDDEAGLVRYKCHIGHAYSPASLEAEQAQALEMALWTALRSLEERADLFRRLARRSLAANTVSRLEGRATEVEQHAGVLRRTLAMLGREPAPVGVDAGSEE